MKSLSKLLRGIAIATAYVTLTVSPASALTFNNGDYGFYSLNPAPSGSGLGNYNIILYENAQGGSGNSGGTVNVDDSNTLLPTGGTSGSGTLYWMVSVADLQAFYLQQFSSTPINNKSAVGSEISVVPPAVLPGEIAVLFTIVVPAEFPRLASMVAPQPFGSRSQSLSFPLIDKLSGPLSNPLILTL